ncbi:DNA polymerase-3 subunit delta' [Desulfacinum hydrothermale DSM 13146]|uniref:DNA polymerase-3 subunit delta n=1 Tax=Desulfacinum hydrothermale DSM 13146 TaxID=1121390 RepID=A0A1W1XET6_9BACT|nr:DNA polymerase III subunit delta' [Desulfacinum hydrothermale]SMC22274.1 DNA polymerase-3 subunit delta' [Desulfacinum hydrothermale DSM 13146]
MSLDSVAGQTRAKRFLAHLLRTGNLPHALLLSGMEGIGKGRLALELAKGLNCRVPPASETGALACGACEACDKIARRVHPDVVWVEREGTTIKLARIKEVRERCRVRPFEGAFRVTIIQDAQALTEEAGNALLKILEEPPPRNVFILLALDAQMLLPTLVSRCCHVRCQPLEDEQVRDLVMDRWHLSKTQAEQVARLSFGSLEWARAWAEGDRVERCRQVIQRLLDHAQGPILELFLDTAQWVKESEDLEQDLECIKFWVRESLMQHLGMTEKTAFQELDASKARAVQDPETLLKIYQVVENAVQHLRAHANKQLILEGVCLKIKEWLDGEGHRYSFPGWRQDLSL